ncbi:helix-turn-helix domain-containing protein [Streptomyces sp. NPDC088253]|uniref:helix-turn-helix domain-containing protein n=1 Tax=Streptomyces sp. NPDC088253 TaxID=3365846 RepID=UPI003825FE61
MSPQRGVHEDANGDGVSDVHGDVHGDVEEFAALLRRLKARTDRSYGALARRLNMNTSTLHRYCSGDAVPLDFAPVERFAAMCGATAAERGELHRRWILAAAARQRSRAATPPGRRPTTGDLSAAPAPAESTQRPALTTPPDSATPTVSRHPATPVKDDNSPPEVAESTPRSAPTSKTPNGPGVPDGPGSSPAPTEPQGRPAVVEDHGPTRGTGGTGPQTTLVPGSAPRRPWYKRRLSVAVGVAAVLVAALGSVSALSLSADRQEQQDRHSSGGVRQHAPAPSAHAASAPLTWTANSQLWELGCSHDYVIAKPPGQVPPPPAAQDAETWARTQNAVHGHETLVQISVQGRTSTAVVLEALRVRVVGRAAPAKGTAYAMDQGCGGDISPRSFAVNLDVDRPIAHSLPGSDTGRTVPAIRMPYRVSAQDPGVLLVTARTETCDCRWYLELDWSSQGRTGTLRIDDHGRPFRTSGIKGLPHYWYAGRQWVPLAGQGNG